MELGSCSFLLHWQKLHNFLKEFFFLNFDKGTPEEAELITEKRVGCNCRSVEEVECLTDLQKNRDLPEDANQDFIFYKFQKDSDAISSFGPSQSKTL